MALQKIYAQEHRIREAYREYVLDPGEASFQRIVRKLLNGDPDENPRGQASTGALAPLEAR